jgi:hypothetical protein
MAKVNLRHERHSHGLPRRLDRAARRSGAILHACQRICYAPNILKPETIQVMTTGSAANAGYAKGWAVNEANNWWHNGSLPGTSTIAVRVRSGFCWAAFTNTRRTKSALDRDLDRLVWKMVAQVKNWRA